MKSKKMIFMIFITVVSILINIVLIVVNMFLHNEFNSYSNNVQKDRIEKDINIDLYNESLKMIEYINHFYDDIEELSEYEYKMLNKKEPIRYKLNETGEFQSCRDNLFQIFEYIYVCHDSYDIIDGVYFEYYSKKGFLSYSSVCLCWLADTPKENYTYDVENDTTITMKKYINIYDDLYILYDYCIYY